MITWGWPTVDRDSQNDWVTRGLPEHPYPLHRFTVDDLYRLGDLGIIGEGLELIEGYIVRRGTGRLLAFFPTDHEEMMAHGVLRRGETVFVDGTIRDVPSHGART
jgi:hypothetical protein